MMINLQNTFVYKITLCHDLDVRKRRRNMKAILVCFLSFIFVSESWSENSDRHTNRLEQKYHRYKEIYDQLADQSDSTDKQKAKNFLKSLGHQMDPNLEMIFYFVKLQEEYKYKDEIKKLKELEFEITQSAYHPYVKYLYYNRLGFLFSEILDYNRAVIEFRNSINEIEGYEFFKEKKLAALFRLSGVIAHSAKDYETAITNLKEGVEIAKELKDSLNVMKCYYNKSIYKLNQDNFLNQKPNYQEVLDINLKALQFKKNSFESEKEFKEYRRMLIFLTYSAVSSSSLALGDRSYFDQFYSEIMSDLEKGLVDKKTKDYFILHSVYEAALGGFTDLSSELIVYLDTLDNSKFGDPDNDPYSYMLINQARAALSESTNPAQSIKIKKHLLKYIFKRDLLPKTFYQNTAKELTRDILEYEFKTNHSADSMQRYNLYMDTIQRTSFDQLWQFKNQHYEWSKTVKASKQREINHLDDKLSQERKFLIFSLTGAALLLSMLIMISRLWRTTSHQSKELQRKKKMLESFNEKLQNNNKELNKLNRETERINNLVNAKNLSLNILNSKLEKTNKSLDMYARVIAHDLKAPLKTVAQLLAFLHEDVKDQINAENNNIIKAVRDQIDKTTLLIQDILDFNRMKKSDMELELVNMNEVMKEVKEILILDISRNKGKLDIGTMPTVLGYHSLVKQLMLNLVNNSFKYRKKDVPVHIEVSCCDTDENNYQISVKDNGIGIKEEDQPNIFGLFQKLHNNREYEGYGIGLATCKKIVDHLNGSIWVESVFGEGTTFHFTVPKTGKAQNPKVASGSMLATVE